MLRIISIESEIDNGCPAGHGSGTSVDRAIMLKKICRSESAPTT